MSLPEPDLEEVDEKCELCGNPFKLRFIEEPKRSQYGVWCPMCVNKGLDKFTGVID